MAEPSRRLDERGLTNALAELADGGQPEPPVGRVAAIRRRHARRRGVSWGVTVIVMLAAGGAYLSTASTGQHAPHRPIHKVAARRTVPGWALSWPEQRSPSITAATLAGAVRAWHITSGGSVAPVSPADVIWYLAEPVGAAHLGVVFEVTAASEHRLVIGYASRSGAFLYGLGPEPYAADGRTGSPWHFIDVPAPPRQQSGAPSVISFYVPVSVVDSDNAVIIDTAPTAKFVRLSTYGTVALRDGFAAIQVGQVRAPLTFTLLGAGPPKRHQVGVAGDASSAIPTLFKPFVQPRGPERVPAMNWTTLRGQGNLSTILPSVNPFERGPLKLSYLVRCYGGQSLQLTVQGLLIGQVSCDDAAQRVSDPRPAEDFRKVAVKIRAGPLTAYTVVVEATGDDNQPPPD
jgi:hypothetical protein